MMNMRIDIMILGGIHNQLRSHIIRRTKMNQMIAWHYQNQD